MFVRRFYDDQLAQASYLLGCQESGAAVAVDANRDVDQYIVAAAVEGLRLTYVTETHIHADFVSGSRELADRTGAQLLLSAEGGPDWQYAFAAAAQARLLHDGDTIDIGAVRLQAVHTPGHTPEHLMFLVTDTAAADRPMAALTGDFLFVGDVGRPDLLERAAHVAGSMERSARDLFRSLQRAKALPDYLQIWPGHGAGSACGRSLGAVPQSSLGYERLVNWALAATDETAFVAAVLHGQPEPPRYFAVMKRINREGPALLGGLPHPERLGASRLPALVAGGATVIDTRHAADFAAGHAPGTLNIPLGRSFSTWAGSLVPYGRPYYLIVDDDDGAAHAAHAARALALIGLDEGGGYFGSAALAEWRASGRPLETVSNVTATEARDRIARGGVTVLDVRSASEWEDGHVPGARWIPLAALGERLGELPADQPLIVHCQGGTRSAIAASVLLAAGRTDVHNLTGGFAEWERAGYPTARDGAN